MRREVTNKIRFIPHSPDEPLNCAAVTPIQIQVSAPYIIGSRGIMAHPTGESELNTDFDRFCFVEARHQNGEIGLVDRAMFGLILTDTTSFGT